MQGYKLKTELIRPHARYRFTAAEELARTFGGLMPHGELANFPEYRSSTGYTTEYIMQEFRSARANPFSSAVTSRTPLVTAIQEFHH
jgi:hypothetical protein